MGTTYMAINTTKKQYFDAGDKHPELGETAQLLAYLLHPGFTKDSYPLSGSWCGDHVEIISEHDERVDEHELYSFAPGETDWNGPLHDWTDIARELEGQWNDLFGGVRRTTVYRWRFGH